ncbi:MAG: hemin uptake protein HemP [Rhodocyclaceae bacterium]
MLMATTTTPNTPVALPEGAESAPRSAAQQPAWKVIASDALLRGDTCVHIEHDGVLYVLRATRNGKLILTK